MQLFSPYIQGEDDRTSALTSKVARSRDSIIPGSWWWEASRTIAGVDDVCVVAVLVFAGRVSHSARTMTSSPVSNISYLDIVPSASLPFNVPGYLDSFILISWYLDVLGPSWGTGSGTTTNYILYSSATNGKLQRRFWEAAEISTWFITGSEACVLLTLASGTHPPVTPTDKNNKYIYIWRTITGVHS